jgi:hypothetical protein
MKTIKLAYNSLISLILSGHDFMLVKIASTYIIYFYNCAFTYINKLF